MPQDIVNVMILGASGLLGSEILSAVTQQTSTTPFKVSILTRQSSKATFPSSSNITIHSIKDSYPLEELIAAFQGQQSVVSALPGGDVELSKRIIAAAVTAGVRRFIPSEFGNNTCQAASRQVPLYAQKAEIAAYLKGVTEKESGQDKQGLTFTAIHCGQFFDWGLETGWLDFNLSKKTAKIYDSGERRWSTTNIPTVGVAVAKVLGRSLDDEAVLNKHLLISSFTVSQNEVLKLLEGEGEKWQVERMTSMDTLDKASAVSDQTMTLKLRVLMLMYADGEDKGANFENDPRLANDLLGLERENIEEIVGRLLK